MTRGQTPTTNSAQPRPRATRAAAATQRGSRQDRRRAHRVPGGPLHRGPRPSPWRQPRTGSRTRPHLRRGRDRGRGEHECPGRVLSQANSPPGSTVVVRSSWVAVSEPWWCRVKCIHSTSLEVMLRLSRVTVAALAWIRATTTGPMAVWLTTASNSCGPGPVTRKGANKDEATASNASVPVK
jgi:hypothetical protein